MATQVRISVKGDKELMALVNRLPQLMRYKATDRAVRKAGAIVRTRARQLAPNSKRSGTVRKQTAKSQKKWPKTIKQMMRMKVIKYERTAVAIIGPKSPEGNAAYFVQAENTRRHVLWGKSTSVQGYRAARNFIKQAFDETKTQQNAAMKSELRQALNEVVK